MDLKTTFISAIVSVIVAYFTGWFSSKLSYGKEIKKSVYAEREKLYIEIFNLVEQLQRNPYLIYNTEKFILPFRQMKAKTNLYASRKVLDILVPFNDKVMTIWNKYTDLFESENAERTLQNRKFAIEENGTDETPEQIEWEFQQEAELFMDNNIITNDEIVNFLNNLTIQIRSELKTE